MCAWILRRIVCMFVGHDWYIVDFFYGMENNHVWNIRECDRCNKAELD